MKDSISSAGTKTPSNVQPTALTYSQEKPYFRKKKQSATLLRWPTAGRKCWPDEQITVSDTHSQRTSSVLQFTKMDAARQVERKITGTEYEININVYIVIHCFNISKILFVLTACCLATPNEKCKNRMKYFNVRPRAMRLLENVANENSYKNGIAFPGLPSVCFRSVTGNRTNMTE